MVKEVSKHYWDSILERMQKKLARWKGNILSSTGKLQFLVPFLQGIAMNFLSLFKISCSMEDNIEKIQRIFLCTNDEEMNIISLVRWDTMCKLKGKGGLGVRNISDLNRALITKICWWIYINQAR